MTEYAALSNRVTELESKLDNVVSTNLDHRVQELERKIGDVTSGSTPASGRRLSAVDGLEDAVAELEDRRRRAPNVIIYGFPEPETTVAIRAIEEDLKLLKESLSKLAPDFSELVRRVSRLGPRRPNEVRPLKVVLDSPSTATRLLVANRASNPRVFSASSDRTPLQREHLRGLRAELGERVEAGEQGITIRYKNGVPRIVPVSESSSSSKN